MKDIYSESESKALLTILKKNDFLMLRDSAIIWLLATTGARAKELRNITINNVDLDRRVITLQCNQE
ncbi:site-specific integrase [Clostridium beijerinckii]|uniref:tyrosine-type recombinase/integrase n=1 Tax=Clostridium beijerinckii TaxID=1520 RepID=UPI0019CFBA52|nr:tyrosine-type recombinase/integrase [Clostridium beijerinckii]MBN7581308.1 site-specific integrase [Clostridium beijerinckii]